MNLYRTKLLPASLLLLAVVGTFTMARAQRKKPHKLRAIAVLELAPDSAGHMGARLTPVTILAGGRFRDASIYEAAPRPMAADIGVVYEAQKAGVPVGYVTITGASDSSGIWTAQGKWQTVAQVAKKKAPASKPKAAESDDARPILHRGDSSGYTPPAPAPTPAAQPSPQSAPEPESDDSGRPILRRRGPEAEATPSPEPAATPSQPGSAAAAPSPTPAPETKLMVAVSDNQPSDERSFAYPWRPGEKEKMEARLRKLALAQLPPGKAKLNVSSLRKVVIHTFDLDDSNEPVMVLTADIPDSPMTPKTRTARGRLVTRYITLIARVDFDGNLQRLAVSVTDSSRLDVAPRLELIDAVDADGDGYGELLFREYSFDEKGFIVYGVGRGAVTKVFEGATQAIN